MPDFITSSTRTVSPAPYNPQQEIDRVRAEIKQVNFILVGIVIFIVMTFIIFIFTSSLDRTSDKSLYLKYSDLHEKYSESNLELREQVESQRLQVNNLNKELELLRARNSYLK